MADNTTLNTGTGGDTIASDDIGGVKFQRIKLVYGADGSNDGDVDNATGAGLPVQGDTAIDAAVGTRPVFAGGRASAATPTSMSADNDLQAIWLTLAGAVNIADAGGSLTVDNTDITTIAGAVSGTEMQVDVVASLPAGTNAIGKLAANSGVDIGDVDVTSIIPGTGATNLGKATDAAAGASDTGVAILSIRDDALSALTPIEGDYAPTRVDANGALWVKVADTTLAVTQSGTWNINNVSGTVSLPTGAATAANQSTIIGHVDGIEGLLTTIDADTSTLAGAVSGTEMQVDIVASLPAGTNAIGKLSANSGVDIGDVDVTSIAAGTNSIGNVGLIGRTTGGMTISRTISAASTNSTLVKNAAGQVFSITVFNLNASARFLKLYNKATAPTVGTDTPVLTFVIPGNTSGAGFVWNNEIGYAFGTGIGLGLTTGIADSDTGAVAANEIVVNIGYA